MEFDVDVSDVGCACAAGVYLVDLDDGNCSWGEKSSGETPQCARIEVMESNIWGFNAASYPCEFGSCQSSSASQQHIAGAQYGPGSSYTIDTTKSYHVATKFYSLMDEQGYMTELTRIETTLSQEGRSVVVEQSDADFLSSLSSKLEYGMAVAVSNQNVGLTNDISGTCSSTCDDSLVSINNWSFTMFDSIDEVPVTWVDGGVADNVDDCGESNCSGCAKGWWSNTPEIVETYCYDYQRY